MNEGQTAGIFLFHGAAGLDGRWITVDRGNGSASFKYAFGVPTCSERAIDDQLIFHRLERRNHFVKQNRDVAAIFACLRGIAAGTRHQLLPAGMRRFS